MSLQAAILASLLEKNDCSGYELTKQFVHSCVSLVWQVPQQQIYRELKKMENNGLVVSKTVAAENGTLTKKLYQITAAGSDTLVDWLRVPSEPEATRDALMVKLFAGYLVDTDYILAEIEQHRAKHQALLEHFERLERECFNGGRDLSSQKRFPHLVLLHRISEERNWVSWCQTARAQLKQDALEGAGR